MNSTPQAEGKGIGKTGPTVTETRAKSPGGPAAEKAYDSYAVFELCIERAKSLIKLHTAAHGRAGKPEKCFSDAHRAAIVLAVSALDAFVRDFMIARTRALLASRQTELPASLKEEIKRFVKEDALLEAARKDDLLERVEKAFRSQFDRRSFQGTKNITETLRIVGYEDVFHEVAIRGDLNEDTLRRDLDRFTNRRHAIAHQGDYDLTQNPPVENVVTKKDATDCIKLMSRIAQNIQNLGTQP